MNSRIFLFICVFVEGMTTMAFEFTASRMVQTVFGTSNIVWANVIGIVLFFLAVGYFLGGRIADRNPRPILFYGLMVAAGVVGVFLLLMTSVFLRETTSTLAAYSVGATVGSFVCLLMAIAIPITMLGCLSPFAIRLGVRHVGEAGSTSGRVYAASTWGSLFGTYASVLYVIPTIGPRMTAVLFGSILILFGLIGVYKEMKKASPKLSFNVD